ncbi:MAG: YkgJ family cysteine cluster protein [Desulfocucumaceae bacterium]
MSLKMHRDMVDRLESGSAGEINMEDTFSFECDDRCMGRCCNTIKIMLDPWDVETMARHLEMSGREFLDKYCELEEDPRINWPYVKLFDAERGPCVFMLEQGKCSVYPVRSRNCRTYPVGRAVRFDQQGDSMEEKFFMVEKQAFCFGHSASRQWTLREWLDDAGSVEYFEKSDIYFKLIDYASSVLECGRWMNSRVAQMMMPFLYGPEVLRAKMGIAVEEVGHSEFYNRRMKALKVLLTEMAAGFGFGPNVKGGDEEVEDFGVMDRVKGILVTGEDSK